MTDARFAKLVVFVNALVPLAILAWDGYHDRLGANPVEFVLHTTGMLALVFLTLSLAVTPLRKLTKKNFLSHFRKLLGLYAFFYGVLHLITYLVFIRSINLLDIWDDVLKHPYIAIGMAALLMLVPLALTSTNGAIKRLGAARWKQLHRLAYAAAIAGVVHYYMLVKADTSWPIAFGVAVGVLLLFRVYDALRPRNKAAVPPKTASGAM
jgi:sulfoxide reductase heme-binding subunit YedZ